MQAGLEKLSGFAWERLLKVGRISVSVMFLEKCGLIRQIIKILQQMMIATVRYFLFGHWRIANN